MFSRGWQLFCQWWFATSRETWGTQVACVVCACKNVTRKRLYNNCIPHRTMTTALCPTLSLRMLLSLSPSRWHYACTQWTSGGERVVGCHSDHPPPSFEISTSCGFFRGSHCCCLNNKSFFFFTNNNPQVVCYLELQIATLNILCTQKTNSTDEQHTRH